MRAGAHLVLAAACGLSLAGCGGGSGGATVAFGLPGAAVSAPRAVTLEPVDTRAIGREQFGSSTRLRLRWQAPEGAAPHHYRATATDALGGPAVQATAAGGDTQLLLQGLKAATAYAVTLTACGDADCTQRQAAAAVSGSTAAEVWQLQGSGRGTAGLTRIVSDGNARISATRFGPEAGAVTAGRVQLYYGPSGLNRQVLSTALGQGVARADDPASYLLFNSSQGRTGLQSPGAGGTLVSSVATGQAVPLSAAMGARVRLFFEAQGADGRTRILWLDSADGYTGQDFHTGAAALCASVADFAAGGGCAPRVAIGVEGDADAPTNRVRDARQHKLGYPTLDDWRWSGSPGTFMVFTVDRVAGCADAPVNHGYAVWDGSRFQVQYQANGCPKLFTSAQAAFPLHAGGPRYKLYYGDPSIGTGRLGSGLPFLGPKKLIHADARRNGADDRVDFEDWEPQSAARDVVFLWPDGERLDDTAEGYIDDFHFLHPTGNASLQVMYLAITNGTEMPFGAAAILLNP